MATRANGIMKQIALSMYHMLRKTKGVLCTKYVQDVKRKSNLKNMERIRVLSYHKKHNTDAERLSEKTPFGDAKV